MGTQTSPIFLIYHSEHVTSTSQSTSYSKVAATAPFLSSTFKQEKREKRKGKKRCLSTESGSLKVLSLKP